MLHPELFNNDVALIHDAVPLRDVPPLLPAQYQPSGGTALNDAVAHLIHSLGRHAQGRNTAVLAVILTDGMENGSRHSQEDVRQMVTYRRLTHGWQFLFLGPESALSYALSIGISKVNTASFETTPEGLRFMLKRRAGAWPLTRLEIASSCSSSSSGFETKTIRFAP